MSCKDCEGLKVGEATIKAVKEVKGKDGAVMMALHKVQDAYGYISLDNQKYLSRELGVPLSEIYGIITFYNRFTLTPKGKYNIQVCVGTACYVKGAETILDAIQKRLGIKDGQTTEDGLFSLEAVRCLGACGLAPVMVVNKDVYGKVTLEEVNNILDKYVSEESK